MRRVAPLTVKLRAGLAVLLAGEVAFAATFTSALDRNIVPAGETLTLTLNLDGVNAQVTPPMPALSNLAIRGVSPGYRMANGKLVGLSYTCTLQAIQPGVTTVPSIAVAVGEEVLRTQPLQVHIVPAVTNTGPAFLRLYAAKTEVYLGEGFPVEVHLYFQNINDPRYPRLNAPGFSLVQSEEPLRTSTQVAGVGYNVFIFKMAATAARPGNLQLGPAECALTVLIPLPRNPRDPFALFGPNFQPSPTNLQSAPVAMRVLPLPSENVPASFNGAVGTFSMAVSASPTNLAAGDPITVKISIAGQGRLDAVVLPDQPQWRDYNTYPPNKKIESSDPLGLSGTVRFEKVLIPQNHEVRLLSPFEFSFFDPAERQYRTLSGPAFPLTVRPGAVTTVVMPQTNVAAGTPQPSGDDILHIRAQFAAGSTRAPLLRQPWFVGLQTAPVLTWLTLVVVRKRRESLANNPRMRRQREVARRVRAGLKELHSLAAGQNSDAFFAVLFRLLQEQIGERLDVPASSITESIVDERLQQGNLPPATLTELHELFQVCNQARYAPQKTSQELSAIIPRAEGVLAELQRLRA